MKNTFNLSSEQVAKIQKVLNIENKELSTTESALLDEAVEGIRSIITLCGDDTTRDGLQETPFRVVKAFLENTVGYQEDPAKHLEKTFDVDHNSMVLVRDIEFHSMCEHHFAPFYGVAHVAYVPNDKITGLSKIARVVEGYSKRFQVQERLTNEIADAIKNTLKARYVAVQIEAKHMCMCGRGIKKSGASTVTNAERINHWDSNKRIEPSEIDMYRNQFLNNIK